MPRAVTALPIAPCTDASPEPHSSHSCNLFIQITSNGIHQLPKVQNVSLSRICALYYSLTASQTELQLLHSRPSLQQQDCSNSPRTYLKFIQPVFSFSVFAGSVVPLATYRLVSQQQLKSQRAAYAYSRRCVYNLYV